MIRVVLAEDNLLVRQGIVGLLSTEPDIEIVAQCASAVELLEAVAQTDPDVVLTDVRMPPEHTDEGVRAANDLRTTHPRLGVVVLSEYDDPGYALRLFENGVAGRGYLLKDHVADPDQLATALRSVAAGGSSIDASIVETMLGAQAASASSPLSHLTPRETEVLAEMASGANNAAIAQTLVLSVRAVEHHINSIFSKLGLGGEEDYHRRVRAVLMFLGA